MAEPTYSQIHAYMLQKTREYAQEPPKPLVDEVLRQARSRGETLSRDQAKKLVSLIDIQRYLKEEMKALGPEFMAGIPENGLR